MHYLKQKSLENDHKFWLCVKEKTHKKMCLNPYAPFENPVLLIFVFMAIVSKVQSV